jgi:hypothetical protein
LVAFRLDNFIITITACFYCWIDFINNTYQNSLCSGFYEEIRDETDKDVINRKYVYFIIYKTFNSIPFSVFSSFIVISLSYRSIIDLVDYVLRYKHRSIPYISRLFAKSKDSFCCDLFNIDDEHEIIYSQCDIDYVLNLLNSKGEKNSQKTLVQAKEFNYVTLLIEKKNFMNKILSIIKKVIKWDPNFRFSSRVINSFVVSFVSLYYVVLLITYNVSYYVNYLAAFIPDSFDSSKAEIPVGDILCSFSSDICIDSAMNYTVHLPVPEKIVQVLPWLRESVIWVFTAPLILSPILCLLQIYLLSSDIKTHLKQLYKGECDFVRKAETIGNASIANASFHFGG